MTHGERARIQAELDVILGLCPASELRERIAQYMALDRRSGVGWKNRTGL